MPMFMLNGKQYGGNGGNYQVARMSKADYDALTDAQKNDGTLRIVVDSAGNSVNYMSAQVAGAKTDDTLTNLLNPTLGTSSLHGVTCTNNGDGTYTLNGTASSDTRFQLQLPDDINVTSGQKVKLVGCPSGGSNQSYQLYTQTVNNHDFGDGVVFDWDSGITGIAIFLESGTPCDNLVFKPMLTPDLQATYDDFVGYTGGTGRLNSDVAEHEKEISRINSDLSDSLDLESDTITVVKNGGINRTRFTFDKKYTRFEIVWGINDDWVTHSFSVREQETQNVVVVVVINHFTSDLSGKIRVRGYVK